MTTVPDRYNLLFSYFTKGLKNITPEGAINFHDLVRLITKDKNIQSIIERLREEVDETRQKEIKQTIPYFTPSGIFSRRKNAGFSEKDYTWICPVDIDHLTEAYEDVFNRICKDDIVLLAARSPRGHGIKVLVQLKAGLYDPKNHKGVLVKAVYPILSARWGCELDEMQASLSQAMLLTHDVKNGSIDHPSLE